jgi:hypothetical protein
MFVLIKVIWKSVHAGEVAGRGLDVACGLSSTARTHWVCPCHTLQGSSLYPTRFVNRRLLNEDL